jgi:hypothetical protein
VYETVDPARDQRGLALPLLPPLLPVLRALGLLPEP